MDANEVCRTCKFWNGDEFKPNGWCYRHAPLPVVAGQMEANGSMVALWPVTNSQDWCGEWEGK